MQVETRGKGTHCSAPVFPKGSTTAQMCETIQRLKVWELTFLDRNQDKGPKK